MTTTIKISQLGNLTTFTDTTLLPVVNTANAFITVKSTGLTLKNYIFSNIGNISATGTITGNVVATNVTGTLLTNAQPNITTIGSLSSLTVTGTVTAGNLAGTLLTNVQPNITTVGTLSGLTVAGNVIVGNLNSSSIEGDIFYQAINFVNVGNTYTYSLSSTITNNILVIMASDPTATIDMPTSPTDGQITRISANANVILAVGTGTVSPSFAGANLLVNPLQYVYSSQYSTWFRI
jgi:hypothetical protein